MAEYCSYPTLDDGEFRKKEFVQKLTNRENRNRRWQMYRMALNVWFWRGAQWIKAPRTLTASGSGYRFERDDSYFSDHREPVDNYIATNSDNAIARFLRKQYKPTANAEKNQPDLLAAARLASDIIEHDAEKKDWKTVQHELAFDFETAGIAIAKTYWDETQLEQVPVAATDAVKCVACETKLSSPVVPHSMASLGIPGEMGPTPMQHPETAEEVEGGLKLNACPTCPEPTEMQPYKPSVEEVMAGETDLLGRPMGEMVPKGDAVWESVSWAEIYPENAGIGIEPHNMKVWGQKTPRPVDWIMARFPEFGEVLAEPAAELIKDHPTMGFNPAMAGASAVYDEGVFDNYAALTEVHIDPMEYPGLEMGHSLYMVGEKIISRPLCVEVQVPETNGVPQEPRKVKKVSYSAARRKRVPREFWGRTPVDDQIPLQRRLNRLDAQVEDVRERGGPTAFIPTDVEVHDRHREGSLNVVEYDSSAVNPAWTPKESLMNAQPLTGNAYHEERDRVVQALQRLGAQDVELGKNPVGAKTIGQLQILAEEAQQQRGPSEDDLKRVHEKSWSHYLELKWAFQKEEAVLEVEGAQNSYERQAYVGTNLLGQTRINLEPKGSTDKQVFQQEVAERAVGMGLYDLTTIAAREELLEILNAPKIDAAKSMQVERANQAWLEFKSEGKVPVFDESTGNAQVWWQVLGNSWLSDEALQMQREADWNSVVRGTAGWQRYFDQAVEKDEAQRAVYEGQDPSQWGEIFRQGTAAVQMAQQTAASATQAGVPAAPPPMTSFPAPPQSGTFLPNSTDQKILLTFRGMLGSLAPDPSTEDGRKIVLSLRGQDQRKASLRERLLRMYSVLQQCRILSEAQMAAMAPAPPVPGTVPQGAAGA